MPVTLYAPGTRKGNRYWMARVLVDGRRVEVSTGSAGKAEARRFAADLEQRMLAERAPQRGGPVSFAQAARLYAEFRGLDLEGRDNDPQRRVEIRAINRLTALIGKRLIAELGQSDLVMAANRLFPDTSPATRNRWAIKPGAAILHYAAEQKLCGWERIRKFKESRPQTRAVSVDLAAELVAAAAQGPMGGPRRLLLVWLFRMGTRITDTLQLHWEDNVNLMRQTVHLHIGKADQWTELPLHPEVFEVLAAVPAAEQTGRLFPWATRSGVYRWLRPLAAELGVAFTPHMARHSVGTWLNESGAGLRTIMAALFHHDPQSSIRYQTADVEIVRAAARNFAPITGKRGAA